MLSSRRLVAAAIAFLLVDLIVTTFWTGWPVDKRLDPLLAIPPRIVTLTLPVLLLAGQGQRARLGFYAGLVAVLGFLGMLVTAMFGERMGWMQHLVLAAVSLLWMILAGALLARARQRWPRAGAFAAAALLAGALAVALCAGFAVRKAYMPAARAAPLTLMTGLPLIWSGDGAAAGSKLSLDVDASPALRALGQRYDVRLVDALTGDSLPRSGPLLLAHPRAMAPAELVDLDAWVRRGGKVLILADAFLAWEPPHPIGDPRNPPITSLLTPLLDHWGLDLVLPANGPESPARTIKDDGRRLRLAAAGLFATKKHDEAVHCQISLGGVRADCAIGKGRAVLLSDADMLHPALWLSPALVGSGDLDLSPGLWRADNIGWIETQLDDLSGTAATAPPLARPLWMETRR